jgi:hypothetical protein
MLYVYMHKLETIAEIGINYMYLIAIFYIAMLLLLSRAPYHSNFETRQVLHHSVVDLKPT